MVNDKTEHSVKGPAKQAPGEVIAEPNKIGASTPYDFEAKNLTLCNGVHWTRTRTVTELICAEDGMETIQEAGTSGGGWEYNQRYGKPKRKFRLRLARSIFMNKRISCLLALAALVAVTAMAHHNMTALFDLNDRVTLNGTFTKVDWRNPHIQLTVEVKDSAGKVETWQIEGPPPSFFRTRDIGKMDFEGAVGKTVTAEASRARDKSTSGLMRVITLPGGKVVSACPQNC